MTSVRDRMTAGVAPIPVDATLVEAARELRNSGAGALPVLDPQGHGCAGILTERDIVIRVLAEEREARAMIVRDVATLRPVTCDPDHDLDEALELMREHEVQHLPVLEAGKVVGVISLADLAFGRPDETRAAFEPRR
jgi:CBS domain-containing protein